MKRFKKLIFSAIAMACLSTSPLMAASSDFAGPYEKLIALDLISQESDEYEWRFIDIVDLDTGKLIFKIEHEVRSATHPLYARPLVNRNPVQSNRGYRRGQDSFLGQI